MFSNDSSPSATKKAHKRACRGIITSERNISKFSLVWFLAMTSRSASRRESTHSPQRQRGAKNHIWTIRDIARYTENCRTDRWPAFNDRMYVLSNAKLENMRVARSASFVRISGWADNILAACNRYLRKIDNGW